MSSKYKKKKINILVTGVGAVIGQGIIKSIRTHQGISKNFNIVGLDRNPDSVGFAWCDKFITKPLFSESNKKYLNFWKRILKNESIDLVIPGIEQDIFFLVRNKNHLQNLSHLMLNNLKLINLSKDKWKSYEYFTKKEVSVIPTTIFNNSWSETKKILGSPPFFIKPRKGSGSEKNKPYKG